MNIFDLDIYLNIFEYMNIFDLDANLFAKSDFREQEGSDSIDIGMKMENTYHSGRKYLYAISFQTGPSTQQWPCLKKHVSPFIVLVINHQSQIHECLQIPLFFSMP